MIPFTVWLDQPDKGLVVDIDAMDFGLATRELVRQRGTMCNPRCELAPAGRLQGWDSNAKSQEIPGVGPLMLVLVWLQWLSHLALVDFDPFCVLLVSQIRMILSKGGSAGWQNPRPRARIWIPAHP